ncbi:MAG: hypothetical protein ACYTBZ_15970 [Planctomycetota bacterium]|jgi:hypothetical protein
MLDWFFRLGISPALLFGLLAVFVVPISGCGFLNPALVGEAGGNPIGSLDNPDGYIALVLINPSLFTVETQLTISKTDGTSKVWSLATEAANFYVLTQDCDVSQISFDVFSYADIGGTVQVPANLGSLTKNDGLVCGSVVAITAVGNPPTFAVTVY